MPTKEEWEKMSDDEKLEALKNIDPTLGNKDIVKVVAPRLEAKKLKEE